MNAHNVVMYTHAMSGVLCSLCNASHTYLYVLKRSGARARAKLDRRAPTNVIKSPETFRPSSRKPSNESRRSVWARHSPRFQSQTA